MIKHLANIITGYRLLGSLLLACVPAMSVEFFLVYLSCGISDMIDGTIARKTGSASAFGARLDTAADFLFLAVSFCKLIPVLSIPGWLWYCAGGIACIKCVNFLLGILTLERYILPHTVLNKITGFLLFLMPFTISVIPLAWTGTVVSGAAMLAAIQEAVMTYKIMKGAGE